MMDTKENMNTKEIDLTPLKGNPFAKKNKSGNFVKKVTALLIDAPKPPKREYKIQVVVGSDKREQKYSKLRRAKREYMLLVDKTIGSSKNVGSDKPVDILLLEGHATLCSFSNK